MDVLVKWVMNQVTSKHPNVTSEQDKSLESSRQFQEGKRFMIIELERYNEIGELLIENRTTGFQGHVCYWDRGQRVSVTRGCPHVGGRDGDANWEQGHIQLAAESGMRAGRHTSTVEQSKKH